MTYGWLRERDSNLHYAQCIVLILRSVFSTLASENPARNRPTFRPRVSRQRAFGGTPKTGVRDFCDMSDPIAGPDRSQVASTERRIGRKPRKFRGKFESMPCSKISFYNNDLWLAERAGFEPSVCSTNRFDFTECFQHLSL